MVELSNNPLVYANLFIPFLLSILFFVYWQNEKNKNSETFKYEEGPFWFGCAIMFWAVMTIPQIIVAWKAPAILKAILSTINTLLFAKAYKYLIYGKEKISLQINNKSFAIHLKNDQMYYNLVYIVIIATFLIEKFIPSTSSTMSFYLKYPDAIIKLPSILFSVVVSFVLGKGLWDTFEDREQQPFKWISAIIMFALVIYQFYDFWMPIPENAVEEIGYRNVLGCTSLIIKTCFISILFILTSAFIKETESNIEPEQLWFKLSGLKPDNWLMEYNIGRIKATHRITFAKLSTIITLIHKIKTPQEDNRQFVAKKYLGHKNAVRFFVDDMTEPFTANRIGKPIEEIKELNKNDAIFNKRVFKRYHTKILRAFFFDEKERTKLRVPSENIELDYQSITNSLNAHKEATTSKSKEKSIIKIENLVKNILDHNPIQEVQNDNNVVQGEQRLNENQPHSVN